MLFNWIKRSVRNAVFEGVNEAVAELAGAGRQPAPALPETALHLPPAAASLSMASCHAEVEDAPRRSRKAGA